MADAADSKSAGGDIVWVRLPPSALGIKIYVIFKAQTRYSICAFFYLLTRYSDEFRTYAYRRS